MKQWTQTVTQQCSQQIDYILFSHVLRSQFCQRTYNAKKEKKKASKTIENHSIITNFQWCASFRRTENGRMCWRQPAALTFLRHGMAMAGSGTCRTLHNHKPRTKQSFRTECSYFSLTRAPIRISINQSTECDSFRVVCKTNTRRKKRSETDKNWNALETKVRNEHHRWSARNRFRRLNRCRRHPRYWLRSCRTQSFKRQLLSRLICRLFVPRKSILLYVSP